jgi:hypothetical protein
MVEFQRKTKPPMQQPVMATDNASEAVKHSNVKVAYETAELKQELQTSTSTSAMDRRHRFGMDTFSRMIKKIRRCSRLRLRTNEETGDAWPNSDYLSPLYMGEHNRDLDTAVTPTHR